MNGHQNGRDFYCGAGAALLNVAVTFPVNKLMFRQQLYGIGFMEALKQLRNDGLKHLFRGVGPPMLQRTSSLSLMFGLYREYQMVLRRHFPALNPLLCGSLAAIGAGTTEAVLLPLERVQTLLQITKYHSRFQNMYHALTDLRFYGLKEYYRGLTAVILRNGPSNALFFGLRKPLKDALPMPHSRIGNTVNDFISGAVLGASLSTLFFPLNVVKSNMQKSLGTQFYSVWTTLWWVYEKRGRRWRKMYLGVHINYTRSFVSWGIINAAYEMLMKLTERYQSRRNLQ